MVTKTNNRMIDGSPVNVMDFGAVGDGVTDDTTAMQSAFNSGFDIYIPPGRYLVTSTINIGSDYQKIQGAARENTTIYYTGNSECMTNYSGLATDDQRFIGNHISDITFEGTYTVPFDFSNIPVGSAVDETLSLTTTALKFKRMFRTTIERCHFHNIHIGIDIRGGVNNDLYFCRFFQNEIGLRGNNAGESGLVALKNTTLSIRKCLFSSVYFGANMTDSVENTVFDDMCIFEPCFTAIHFTNGGNGHIESYFERCYEGVVFNGNASGTWFIDRKCFFQSAVGFWGGGGRLRTMVVGDEFELYAGNIRGGERSTIVNDNVQDFGKVWFDGYERCVEADTYYRMSVLSGNSVPLITVRDSEFDVLEIRARVLEVNGTQFQTGSFFHFIFDKTQNATATLSALRPVNAGTELVQYIELFRGADFIQIVNGSALDTTQRIEAWVTRRHRNEFR
ncbi:hypothetical protein PODOV084v1_p0044 [Vibrio phage 340E47.2]|nr:hypothetical protein PODOV084v1_p0044 [Vibrio phage 340E47.2]QZI91950.1 putative pectin lyase fold protein [Vibrio phage 5P1a]